MARTKATLSRESAAPTCACPVLPGGSRHGLDTCVRDARAFSTSVGAFISKCSSEQQAAWLRTTVEAGRPLFQPWCLEILFTTALKGRVRFGDYAALLGISPKTLAQKLQTLRQADLVARHVTDTQPVLIEYTLTPRGEAAASLAGPLLAHLNLRGIGREREAGVRA